MPGRIIAETSFLQQCDTDARNPSYRVVDIWPHIDPRFGGVGPAAAALAQAIQESGRWKSALVAVCDRKEWDRHENIPESVGVVVQENRRPIADIRLAALLEHAISTSDVCHIHGIWLPHALAATRVAQRLHKPVVFSAHGMLEKWDLANGRLKKRLYSALFQRRSLGKSACLRALCEQEAHDFRAYGLNNPIAIVPNGVAVLPRTDPSPLLLKFPQLIGKRIVLFLGRIHRKKGILDLLSAWPSVMHYHSNAHLLIAGANYDNTEAVARAIISKNNLQSSVTFCGVLNGISKLQALSASWVFCLPSYSEGMSIAVLEALSVGLPAIITPACNVDGVESSGAGLLTSNEPPQLAEVISHALSISSAEWDTMSRAAQLLARSKYDWSVIGERMLLVYRWLLGGTCPEFVSMC